MAQRSNFQCVAKAKFSKRYKHGDYGISDTCLDQSCRSFHFQQALDQGWLAPGFARRGVRFPTGGLYNRIEGVFLCIGTQFSVKISPTSIKFPPPNGRLQPPLSPSCANPLLWMIYKKLQRRLICEIHSDHSAIKITSVMELWNDVSYGTSTENYKTLVHFRMSLDTLTSFGFNEECILANH